MTEPDPLTMLNVYGFNNTEYPYCEPEGVNEGKQQLKKLSSCAKKCSGKHGNPNCLNKLGWDKWRNYDQAFRDYCSNANLGPNPEDDKRESFLPVGLVNLGATCYMNAFLQVWFHDMDFRSGVFKLKVPESEDRRLSPAYQLQVLFGYMQEGSKRSFNPKQLVESMGLNEGEQQDANEFYRLFVSLLERYLLRNETNSTRNFLADLFGGQYTHNTECLSCGYNSPKRQLFTQFELNIRNNITLEDCISQYLAEEYLTGDNQYQCPGCSIKSDAKRSVKLETLPKTLNFQLMRFHVAFDGNGYVKKKSKATVKFSRSLDMSKFMPSNNGMHSGSMMYDLKAVLIHYGTSAYSGHYVSHLYGDHSNRWYKVSDEDCSILLENDKSMFDIDAKTSYIDLTQKDNSAGKHDDVLYESRNAYMLIYRRRDPTVHIDPPKVPQEILNKITHDNSHFDSILDEYKGKLKAAQSKFEMYRERRLNVFANGRVVNLNEPAIVVRTEDLKDWIQRPLKCNEVIEVTDTTGDILCSHGKLSPSCGCKIKRLSSRVLSHLKIEGDDLSPILDLQSNLCSICCRQESIKSSFLSSHDENVELLKRYLKNDPINVNSVWISKNWLSDWNRKKPRILNTEAGDTVIVGPYDGRYKTDVICKHGNLTPVEKNRVLISANAFEFLKVTTPSLESYYNFHPVFKKGTEYCEPCRGKLDAEESLAGELSDKAKSERAAMKSLLLDERDINFAIKNRQELFYVIDSEFLYSWRRWIRDPIGCLRPDSLDNTRLYCEHGRLNVDLNEFNPNGSISEKSNIWPWESFMEIEKSSFYLRFKNAAVFHRAVNPPFSLVREDEFKAIGVFYEVNGRAPLCTAKSIALNLSDGSSISGYLHLCVFDTDGGASDAEMLNNSMPCWDCVVSQAKLKEGCEIYVQPIRQNLVSKYFETINFKPIPVTISSHDHFDDGPELKRLRRGSDGCETTTVNQCQTSLAPRKSKRNTYKRAEIVFVQPEETLKDLKLKIQDLYRCSPLHQRISFCGTEFEDSSITLANTCIVKHMILYLLILGEDEDFNEDDDDDGVHLGTETGFSGTALLG
ncbi:hypothetical protein MP638_002941 [Amoeboaphelidium occidentale]|nr:hypothetical protein MP638_002941 [Amoeboaphelidium occidentale]